MEVPARDGLLEVGREGLEVELVAGEVAVEQRLVLALGDDRLEQVGPQALGERDVLRVGGALDPRAGGVVDDARVEQRDQAGDAAVVVVHRQVQRHDRLVEQPLAQRDGLVEVGPRLVELADDDGPRDAERRRTPPTAAPSRRRARRRPTRRTAPRPPPAARPAARRRSPGAPGVSSRVSLTPACSTCATPSDTERCRRCSTSSLSSVAVPSSTRPARLTAPVCSEQRLDERRLAGAAVADDGDVAHEVRRAAAPVRCSSRPVGTGVLGTLVPPGRVPGHAPGRHSLPSQGAAGQGRRATYASDERRLAALPRTDGPRCSACACDPLLARVVDPVAAALLRAGRLARRRHRRSARSASSPARSCCSRAGSCSSGRWSSPSSSSPTCSTARWPGGSSAAASFGAWLDCTCDRLADAAVFSGLVLWFVGRGRRPAARRASRCSAWSPGSLVSYAKARAEGLGLRCDVGLRRARRAAHHRAGRAPA